MKRKQHQEYEWFLEQVDEDIDGFYEKIYGQNARKTVNIELEITLPRFFDLYSALTEKTAEYGQEGYFPTMVVLNTITKEIEQQNPEAVKKYEEITQPDIGMGETLTMEDLTRDI